MASKSLSANINKTGYLLSGKKKNVEKYQERKIQNPIWFNRLTIKKKGSEKIVRQHNQAYWYQGVNHFYNI